MKIYRSDLAKAVSKDTGFDVLVVSRIAESLFIQMSAEMLKLNDIHIQGLGNFVVKKRKERNNLHDFKTGEMINYPAHYAVKFDLSEMVESVLHTIKVET